MTPVMMIRYGECSNTMFIIGQSDIIDSTVLGRGTYTDHFVSQQGIAAHGDHFVMRLSAHVSVQ